MYNWSNSDFPAVITVFRLQQSFFHENRQKSRRNDAINPYTSRKEIHSNAARTTSDGKMYHPKRRIQTCRRKEAIEAIYIKPVTKTSSCTTVFATFPVALNGKMIVQVR